MKALLGAARLLRESNPVANDAFAGAAQDSLGRAAFERIISCEHCRVEANRWDLVADGVRRLAAATPQVAPPVRPRHTRPRVLAGPRRTMLAASAATALVLLGGAGYGVSTALTGHASGTARTGAKIESLSAVSGCAGLEQASGTLGRVNSTSLVINTASGQPVTVTTTASTMVSIFRAPLSDIIDGASVIVAGPSSDGTIAAQIVSMGLRSSGRYKLQTPGTVAVQGMVSGASTAVFTVVTSGGTQVPVTTSTGTHVMLFHASLGQLPAGSTAIAVGYAEPDGTVSAMAVIQPPPGYHGKLSVQGCSPASIDDAITAALVFAG